MSNKKETSNSDNRPFLTRIKAKVDHLTVDGRTLMAGEECECSCDRAKVVVARGEAELVSGDVVIPGAGGRTDSGKGDQTERATSRAAETRETQTKKG